MDAAVENVSEIITDATNNFFPSCTPSSGGGIVIVKESGQGSSSIGVLRTTTIHNFKRMTRITTRIYDDAFKRYSDRLCQKLSLPKSSLGPDISVNVQICWYSNLLGGGQDDVFVTTAHRSDLCRCCIHFQAFSQTF